MTTRRSVLQLFGLAPIAGPLAAKAARDQAIAELAGLNPAGLLSAEVPSGPALISSRDDWKNKVLRFIVRNALPEWFEDELRQRHFHVGYLDPDIAAKRSWSLSVKIVTQRARNIELARKRALEGPQRQLQRHEFEEQTGVWL